MDMGKSAFGWMEDEDFSFSAQANQQFRTGETPPLQMGQEVGEAVKSAMQPLIPEMAEAVRLQCAREFREFLPVLVEAVRSQCTQEFRAFIPLMVEEMKKLVPSSGSSCHRSSPHQAASSASRSLRLHFVGNLPDELVTLDDIQDHGASLMVELRDSSGSRVEVSDELKIKIFVLDGDLEVEDRDDWTQEDFNAKVAEPRKDKGPLLKGNYEISLSKGVAVVGNISFTDNSSKSTKNGHFRLGAQVVKGLPPGGIREAVSKPFKVKERRGHPHQKPEIPSLEDDIWRLHNIREKGVTWARLVEAGVRKVQDFLQLYHTEEMELQNIAQIRGKKWRQTVNHAKSCLLTNEHYKYCDNEVGVDLVLNCVFHVEAVTINGESSQHHDNLNASQKDLVNKVRRKAYEKRRELSKTCSPTNQILAQVEPVWPSIIPQINMQHTNAGELDMPPSFNCYAPGVVPSLPQQPVDQTQGPFMNPLSGNFMPYNRFTPAMPSFQPGQPVDQTPGAYMDSFYGIGNFSPCDHYASGVVPCQQQGVIHRADELGTRTSRVKWNSVRAVVVMIRIANIVSNKQGLRALKRQKLS